MTAEQIRAKVKSALGVTGDYQNATIDTYIEEVKAFMKSAGVDIGVIESDSAVGCIVRGVADLWNLGSGDAKLSEYFKLRVLQLKTESGAE